MSIECYFVILQSVSADGQRFYDSGKLVFSPPFALQPEEEQGEPFGSFAAGGLAEVILAVTDIDVLGGLRDGTDEGATLNNATVREVGIRLTRFVETAKPDTEIVCNWWGQEMPIPREWINDLARLFVAYGVAGYELHTL